MKLGDKKKIYLVLALIILFAFGFYTYFTFLNLSPGGIGSRSSYMELMLVSYLSENGFLDKSLSLEEATSLLDSDSLSTGVSEVLTSDLIKQGLVPESQNERLTNDFNKAVIGFIDKGSTGGDLIRGPNSPPNGSVGLLMIISSSLLVVSHLFGRFRKKR